MNNLPEELVSIIYDYDGRYKMKYNLCMYEVYTYIYNNNLVNKLKNMNKSLYDYMRKRKVCRV